MSRLKERGEYKNRANGLRHTQFTKIQTLAGRLFWENFCHTWGEGAREGGVKRGRKKVRKGKQRGERRGKMKDEVK